MLETFLKKIRITNKTNSIMKKIILYSLSLFSFLCFVSLCMVVKLQDITEAQIYFLTFTLLSTFIFLFFASE